MKNDPWVRFGIFIRPKISEKPAERRNSRPPSVMLLTARTATRPAVTSAAFSRASSRWGGRGAPTASTLQRGVVSRVHGLRQEPLLVVGPELAHVLVRLDRRVDELVALLLAAPDVEAADDVAEVIEAERAARRVGQRHRAERLDQRVAVLGLATHLLESRLRHHAVDVEAGCVDARDVAVVAHHALDEPLVARGVQVGGVGRARDDADRLVAEALQERIVAAHAAAQDGQLETLVLVLLHELEGIGPREALHDRVDAAELREIRRVVRG